MNKAVIMGRLVADPELRQTGSAIAVTSFTVAVDRPYSPKSNAERQTDWIDVVAWRGTAEFICKYFQKGKPILVEGSIQTRNFEDKNGNKRKSVELVAENVEFVLGDRSESRGESRNAAPVSDPAPVVYANGDSGDFAIIDEDEDLPF